MMRRTREGSIRRARGSHGIHTGDRNGRPEASAIAPMLATPGALPANAGDYGYEFKWDGARCIAEVDGTAIRLTARSGTDVTARYPELAPLAGMLGGRRAALDGEIVALDAEGRPSFTLLQRRLHLTDPSDIRRAAASVPVVLVLFDLLALDGEELFSLPYRRRREMLDRLGIAGEHCLVPPWFPGRGGEVLAAADLAGLEGIVAKRLDSPYRPGARSDDWVKVKVRRRQELVIAGYMPGKGSLQGSVGSLLLGYYVSSTVAGRSSRGQRLFRFAGHVGTGMSDADRRALKLELDRLGVERSPFDIGRPAPGARFAEPRLIAEITFHEWTPDGMLRHPVFLGLRDDKPPTEVRLEEPPIRRPSPGGSLRAGR